MRMYRLSVDGGFVASLGHAAVRRHFLGPRFQGLLEFVDLRGEDLQPDVVVLSIGALLKRSVYHCLYKCQSHEALPGAAGWSAIDEPIPPLKGGDCPNRRPRSPVGLTRIYIDLALISSLKELCLASQILVENFYIRKI